MEVRFPFPAVEETPHPAGALVSAEPAPGGAHFTFENAALTVRFLAPDLLFAGWNGAAMLPSHALAKTDWPAVDAQLSRADDGWSVKSRELELRVSAAGVLRYLGATGRLLREEQAPERRGQGWSQSSALAADECVYGLGTRAAPLNRRRAGFNPTREGAAGAVYRFWNRDPGGAYGPGDDPLYICMPAYLSVNDAGSLLVFHDTTFDGALALASGAEVSFTGGPCRSYIAAGTPESILRRFTELTGRPPLPPRWALGYQHSRWAFETLAEARRVFHGFRERGLPLSVLHLDIDHMNGYRTLTTDPKRFGGLPDFAAELHAAGVRLVAMVDPGVKIDKAFPLYAEGKREGVFCSLPDGSPFRGVVWPGHSVFTDYTSPKARAWWGRQYAGELSRGVDGFWHDMNEPASFSAWGPSTFPLCVRHDMDGRGGDHREAHNVYGMLMNRAGWEGLRTLRPLSRPFIVSRSGWVGMQRWSWSWTGDTDTTWGALAMTLASAIGLGLCGMPYTGPDIGGFAGTPSPELFVRWFQAASFLPFFRTHRAVGLPDREPWSFGEEALAAVRSCMETRVRLMPFWYTLAWQASMSGLPLVRPLFWSEPERHDLRSIDDELLLGNDLLGAPVLTEGAVARTVVLPRGAWYPLAGGAVLHGPGPHVVPAPLSVSPAFARGGSIIPMQGADEIVLHAFAPADGGPCDGVLYTDEGDGYGGCRVDRFRISPAVPGHADFTWTSEGEFPWKQTELTVVLHGFDGAKVAATGTTPAAVAFREA
jgi:alpha-glucosidase